MLQEHLWVTMCLLLLWLLYWDDKSAQLFENVRIGTKDNSRLGNRKITWFFIRVYIPENIIKVAVSYVQSFLMELLKCSVMWSQCPVPWLLSLGDSMAVSQAAPRPASLSFLEWPPSLFSDLFLYASEENPPQGFTVLLFFFHYIYLLLGDSCLKYLSATFFFLLLFFIIFFF